MSEKPALTHPEKTTAQNPTITEQQHLKSTNMKDTVLWIYILLLIVGGLMGFIKGKSKISLITSLIFAALLSLCAKHFLEVVNLPLPEILLGVLLVVFGIRLAKTKKFMPSGLMVTVTALALVLRLVG